MRSEMKLYLPRRYVPHRVATVQNPIQRVGTPPMARLMLANAMASMQPLTLPDAPSVTLAPISSTFETSNNRPSNRKANHPNHKSTNRMTHRQISQCRCQSFHQMKCRHTSQCNRQSFHQMKCKRFNQSKRQPMMMTIQFQW